MESTATLKHARISPQKLRLVADQVRGVPVEKAAETLQFSLKKAATIVEKVLRSAMANAENVWSADVSELKVSSIIVNEGPTLKRIRPRAKGRANRIIKRTSHITIKLSDE